MKFGIFNAILAASYLRAIDAFVASLHTFPTTQRRSSGVLWGLADFLQGRGGEFIKMGGKEDAGAFGPPVVLLGGFPLTMATDEFADMVSDAAPKAWKRGLAVHRITSEGLDLSVGELLDHAATTGTSSSGSSTNGQNQNSAMGGAEEVWDVPVLYFSGVDNDDIRCVSKLIISELYAETGQRAATAKAVPPAVGKVAREMFEEIRRDHTEAMAKLTELDSSHSGQ